jgi:hypothetical protein
MKLENDQARLTGRREGQLATAIGCHPADFSAVNESDWISWRGKLLLQSKI